MGTACLGMAAYSGHGEAVVCGGASGETPCFPATCQGVVVAPLRPIARRPPEGVVAGLPCRPEPDGVSCRV